VAVAGDEALAPGPLRDCEQLVDRAWQELGPAIELFGLPRDEAARREHRVSHAARRFVAECTAAEPEVRRCFTSARELLRVGGDCPGFLRLPDLDRWTPARAVRPEPPELSAAAGRRELASLAGAWVQAPFKIDATTIGERRLVFRGKRLELDGEPHQVTMPRRGLVVARKPGEERHFLIARAGTDRFYSSWWHTVIWWPDRQAFELELPSRQRLVVRGERCSTVTRDGLVGEATCTREGDRFTVRYDSDGPAEASYLAIDGFLVRADAVPFVRR
jgi:hypothetical protein